MRHHGAHKLRRVVCGVRGPLPMAAWVPYGKRWPRDHVIKGSLSQRPEARQERLRVGYIGESDLP